MNALADQRVADYLNENFVCTYLKVGTFQIVNGEKQGGNVASYYCLPDGSVVNAIAGPVDADQLLSESRWAVETRKSASMSSTDLVSGARDMSKYAAEVQKAQQERFYADSGGNQDPAAPLSDELPRDLTQPAQVHWLLATHPLGQLNTIYPVVWTQVLGEQLSGLPVAKH